MRNNKFIQRKEFEVRAIHKLPFFFWHFFNPYKKRGVRITPKPSVSLFFVCPFSVLRKGRGYIPLYRFTVRAPPGTHWPRIPSIGPPVHRKAPRDSQWQGMPHPLPFIDCLGYGETECLLQFTDRKTSGYTKSSNSPACLFQINRGNPLKFPLIPLTLTM